MQQSTFQLILKSKAYTIPTVFKHTIDMSREIYNFLIFTNNHSYQVKSNVSDQVFHSFINYLINDEDPDITIENFNQYLELSQEFNLLNSLLADKKEFFGEYLVNLNSLHEQGSQNLPQIEKDITKNLDDYLQKHGEFLMKSPIQSLYRIFNHKDRNLTNHNLAYELIEKNFESTKNPAIFVLLDSIDGTKLSKSNLSNAIYLKSDRCNHMPNIDFTFITNAISKEEELQKKITSLSTEFSNFKQETENFLRKIESQHIEKIKNLEEKHRDEILSLKNQIKKNEEKSNELINSVKKKNEKELDDLNEKIGKYEEKINELIDKISKQANSSKNENEKLTKLIQENNESHVKVIDSLQNKIDENEKQSKSQFSSFQKMNESINESIKKNSANIDVIQQKIENVLFIKPDIESPGIINYLQKKQKTKFDRLFIASQSSCDIYNIIDPNTNDSFCTNQRDIFFIDFELKNTIAINGIKIFSSYKYFPKSFDIEIKGEKVFSTQEAVELNGPNKEMKIEINSIRTQKVRFIRTGQNWDKNTNYVMIKRIELFSNERKYSKGVFATLVKSSENHDPHRSDVFISSTSYSFNSFYLLNTDGNTSTLNKENSWFQIELTKGFALITGFRFSRGNPFKVKKYKIICTCDIKNPIEDWTTLIEINEKGENEHKDNDIYLVTQPSPPVKYIRLVQTGQNWGNNFFLKFLNFDIFGNYF